MAVFIRLREDHNKRNNVLMKKWVKLMIAIGIVFAICVSLFFWLRGNSPIRSDDSFAEVLRNHAALAQDSSPWDAERRYALHDIDGNGTMALLLASPGGISNIYTIQDGVSVQIKSFPFGDEDGARLLSNGVIAQHYELEIRFYRFEDGELIRFATLVSGVGGVNNYHILADGTEIPITWDERWEISERYGGDWMPMNLDWRPLAEFG